MGRYIAVSHFVFESRKFVELRLPGRSLRMPHKTDRIELLDTMGCHGGGRVVVFKFRSLVALSLDPSSKHGIFPIGMGDAAVSVLVLVLYKLLVHAIPLFLLVRTESGYSLVGSSMGT